MNRTDTKIHRMLSDHKNSASKKYKQLVIGKDDLWSLIKHEAILLLCAWVPGVVGFFLRSKLFPLLLGRAGKGVVFGTNVLLRHPHKVFIGDYAVIDDNCVLDAKGSTNSGIFIGDKVFVGRNSILSCKDGDIYLKNNVNIGFNSEVFSSSFVEIGENTLLAAYCFLIGGGNYEVGSIAVPYALQDGLSSKGIKVGANCWLGAGVKVIDGATIEDGCMIGAAAVVKGRIPAGSMAVGAPARVVKSVGHSG